VKTHPCTPLKRGVLDIFPFSEGLKGSKREKRLSILTQEGK